MTEQKSAGGSFWQSMPGMLTGLATALAAVGGLVAALHSAGVIGDSKEPAQEQIAAAQPDVRESESATTETHVDRGAVEPELYNVNFPVVRGGGEEGTQSSFPLEYQQEFSTAGHLVMQFQFSEQACSEIKLQVLVDGRLMKDTDYFDYQTGPYNLGPIDPGSHHMTLIPTGKAGGCNAGTLESWSGSLTLELSQQ